MFILMHIIFLLKIVGNIFQGTICDAIHHAGLCIDKTSQTVIFHIPCIHSTRFSQTENFKQILPAVTFDLFPSIPA